MHNDLMNFMNGVIVMGGRGSSSPTSRKENGGHPLITFGGRTGPGIDVTVS